MNECSTTHVFFGAKEKVKKLEEKITELLNNSPEKTGDAPANWLGQLIKATDKDPSRFTCRGWIEHTWSEDDCFYVSVIDAWTPNIKPWKMLLEHLDLDTAINHEWIAEEPGCNIYLRSEGFHFDRYVVDVGNSYNNVCEYFFSEEELVKFVNKAEFFKFFRKYSTFRYNSRERKRNLDTFQKIKKAWEIFVKAYPNYWGGIHEFEEVFDEFPYDYDAEVM